MDEQRNGNYRKGAFNRSEDQKHMQSIAKKKMGESSEGERTQGYSNDGKNYSGMNLRDKSVHDRTCGMGQQCGSMSEE